MSKRWALVAAATTIGLLGGCGEPADEPGGGTTPASGQSAPMSPSDLPTMPAPTAPPTAPTDMPPKGVVAGRVTALSAACTDVTTDDAVVWSLSGETGGDLAVGDTVRVKVAALDPGERPCGGGKPARIVALTLVN